MILAMSTSNICILISITVYLIFVVLIGFKYSKESNSVDEYYLGGRKLGPLVTAMSAEASDMSSWLLMGLPGLAYATGIASPLWTAIGLAIGTYVNWLVVAKRLRRYSQVTEAITIPDFFSRRYHDKYNILMGISAVVIIIFFVPYTASGFAACGKLFGTIFNADYFTAMVISAAVIVIYTTLGGFLAASTSDFIQSVIMTIALVIVLSYGVIHAGGFEPVIDNAKNLPGFLDMFHSYNGTAKPDNFSALSIVSTLAWGLGYFGMPHILLRFMAIKDEDKLKVSRRVASIWVVISLAIAVFIGVMGVSVSERGIIPAYANNSEAERIIVHIAKAISNHGILPALVGGLILAGILASTMSTADSQLLAASSSVSHNIFSGLFHIKMGKKMPVIIARISVVLIAVVAIFIARNPESSVFEIVSFAWAGFGAAFGPVVLFSLFWKRTTLWGALAGMVSGGAMVFIWKYVIAGFEGVFAIYELLPAFLVSSILIIVVSLLTKKPSEDIVKEFELAKSKEKI